MSSGFAKHCGDRRLRPPSVPARVVARPRLDRLFAECFDRFDVVEVLASPGAGKTVAAQLFAAKSGRRVAWLNLDATDGVANQLVIHLGRALVSLDPAAPTLVDEALRSGVGSVEVAASLADAVAADDVLLVLDNCEAVAEDPGAAGVVTALLTYLPTSARTLLLTREPLESMLGRIGLDGRVGRISDADLAFDAAEAHDLLEAAGRSDVDVGEQLSFTGGWAAGMTFAMPLDDRASPTDMAGYLNSQLLARLPAEEQAFLLRTSLLSVLTPVNVEEMWGPGGPALLHQIARRRLLSTVEAGGSVVHHPCFRQFLSEQLTLRMSTELPDVWRKHARILAAEGEYEAAVEGLLRLDLLDEAAIIVEQALSALYERGAWSLILDWLDAVGARRVAERSLLVGARVRALTQERRLPEAQSLIRELHESGRLRAVADVDPGVVAFVGLAFVWKPQEGLAITDQYAPDHHAESVRYTLKVSSGTATALPPPGNDLVEEVRRTFTWGLFLQGRVDELARFYPTPGSAHWPPRRFYRTPQPLLSMIWGGDLGEVRRLWDEVPLGARQPNDPDLSHNLEAWILLAEGDAEAAVRAGTVSVGLSQRTRYGWEPYLQLVVAQALLRLGRHSDARTVLAEVVARCTALKQSAYLEWARAYDGLAQLLTGGDPAAAAATLQTCVDGMQRAGRRVMLPGALAYLSEATARLGDEAQARELFVAAERMAAETKCVFPLEQAVLDLPELARWSHRADPGGPGHHQPARTELLTPRSIEVRPFGHRPDICIDGRPCGLRRLKVIELAAYLAAHDGVVARHQVQLDLLPEHDRRAGSNYFRQIAHQFRRATGVALSRKDTDWVTLAPGAVLTSIDVRLQSIAACRSGDVLPEFLTLVEQCEGTYLAASSLPWVDRRRFELDVLRAEVLHASADAALGTGDLPVAERLAELALRDDPFCGWAFRALDAAARRSGLAERRRSVYRRAQMALAELEITPEDIGLQAPRI